MRFCFLIVAVAIKCCRFKSSEEHVCFAHLLICFDDMGAGALLVLITLIVGKSLKNMQLLVNVYLSLDLMMLSSIGLWLRCWKGCWREQAVHKAHLFQEFLHTDVHQTSSHCYVARTYRTGCAVIRGSFVCGDKAGKVVSIQPRVSF